MARLLTSDWSTTITRFQIVATTARCWLDLFSRPMAVVDGARRKRWLGPEAPELEQLSSAGDRPVPNAKSDHVLRPYVDNEIPAQSDQPPD